MTGLDCADCAVKLQAALGHERGVRKAEVNFGAATLAVAIDPDTTDLDAVYRAVRRLGYDTVERRAAAVARSGGVPAARRSFWLREPRALLTLLSGAFVIAGFAAEALAPAASPWLFGAAVVVGGSYVARAALFSLRARQIDMNVLMTLAVIGAIAIGQWSEAGLVSFLFGLGTVLQLATLERTRRAISGLMELAPKDVTVLLEGRELTVPVSEVAVGDVIVIRPGERAAVDGRVLQGIAAADQAPITGESRPVSKAPGDQVFAGSIIENGTLHLRATSGAADNTVAKIVHLVEEAQAQRAPAESMVDRFARYYTPAVIALAAAVALVPPLLGASFDTWFYRGLALLIISCPCALVISTPVTILAALGRATRDGVLIKGGVYLEQAARVRAIALDKTGTLTEGRPRVTDVVPLRGDARGVLRLAAELERPSEHPLARAIVAEAEAVLAAETTAQAGAQSADAPRHSLAAVARTNAVRAAVLSVAIGADAPASTLTARQACDCACEATATAGLDDECSCCHEEPSGGYGPAGTDRHDHDHASGVRRFRALPGLGVRGEVEGRLCFAGRPGLLGAHAADAALAAAVERLEREGKTAVAIGDEDGAIGVIAVSDPLRAGAAEAIAELRRLGVQHVVMVTGDNPETAAAVAAQAGIHDVRAGLLPADKVAAVAELRDRYGVGRDGRRRRQRRAGSGRREPGHRHGRGRHRRGAGDRRHRAHGRRPRGAARHHPPGAPRDRRHPPEHRLFHRRESAVRGPRPARPGDPLAGRVRRHGYLTARHRQRSAVVRRSESGSARAGIAPLRRTSSEEGHDERDDLHEAGVPVLRRGQRRPRGPRRGLRGDRRLHRPRRPRPAQRAHLRRARGAGRGGR